MAAIYQWLVGGFTVQTLTTTLYPIEVIDALQFSANISTESSMSAVPGDELDVSASIQAVSLNIIRLTHGPEEDAVDVSASILSVVLNLILLSHGPEEDAVDVSASIPSVILDVRRVEIDTPDEKLQLNCDVQPSGCSMTPV